MRVSGEHRVRRGHLLPGKAWRDKEVSLDIVSHATLHKILFKPFAFCRSIDMDIDIMTYM